MEGPPLGPGGEDITWPDLVAPRGQKASSTRKIKPPTSNLLALGKYAADVIKISREAGVDLYLRGGRGGIVVGG